MKKFEKMKRDLDKVQADFSLLAKERNDAVSQLSKEMKEIDRLEAERVGLFARIDAFERAKTEKESAVDVSKSIGDLNLKLKMELGATKAENESITKEKDKISNVLITTKAHLKEMEQELKSTKTKFSESSESCTNLKNLLEATQSELKKARAAESTAKLEVTKAMKESVQNSDGQSKVSKELDRVDKERKDALQKIQSLHNENKDLKSKLSEFEASKSQETKKLQDALTEALKSNKKVQEQAETEKMKYKNLEEAKQTFEADLAALKKEKAKAENEAKNLGGILDKKKKAENELEEMIKDLKEKLDKYENEKKTALKGEKTRRESVIAKSDAEKKELEEKLEKMKIQFEKAAIESRKTMTKLEEENASAKSFVSDAQVIFRISSICHNSRKILFFFSSGKFLSNRNVCCQLEFDEIIPAFFPHMNITLKFFFSLIF